MAADTAVPLGIVLTELITNAVKYAFPPPRSGTILAQVHRRPPGRVEAVIRDDGIGMFHLREGSLGYGLVRSLVGQIGGEMNIQSDPGLTVSISFPDAALAEIEEHSGNSKWPPANSAAINPRNGLSTRADRMPTSEEGAEQDERTEGPK